LTLGRVRATIGAMPRRPRVASGGYVYHVLNRAVGRARLFESDADYEAFVRVLGAAPRIVPMRLLAWCLMPNHWHLLVWPRKDGDLSEYLRWVSVTHTQRWHAAHGTAGTGPLYQGRFKSFPVQSDEHYWTVCRYVERNPLRANLVRSAAKWRWSSLAERSTTNGGLLAEGPAPLPRRWAAWVERAESPLELMALRRSLARGAPFGSETWQKQTALRLGLGSSLRPRGRPKKAPAVRK
jgi:REP-associated tyrosine transposase